MAVSEAIADARPEWGNLIAAIATIAAADVALGLTFPLLAILMDTRGVDATLIGLNAAMGPLGILLAGPFIPKVAKRVGPKRLAMLTIMACILVLIGFKLFPSVPAWFLLRFLIGVSAGTLFTLSEAWIVHFAEGPRRGLIMGVYTMVLALSFALGPVILPFVDIEGWTPWLIGGGALLVALVPLFFVQVQSFEETESASTLSFARRAPLLLFAVATCTMFDAVMLAFFPIYGLRNGLPLSDASFILAVAIAGNAVLQVPVGMLCDKYSPLKVMVGAAVVTVLLAASMPFVISSWLIWPLAVFFGTSAYSIYTAALAFLGLHVRGNALIAASAAFGAMWGIGGVAGPSTAGAMVDVMGPNAVPVFFASTYLILLIGLFLSRGRLIAAEVVR